MDKKVITQEMKEFLCLEDRIVLPIFLVHLQKIGQEKVVTSI